MWLHRLGAQVYGFSLAPNTTPSLFEVARIEDRVHSTLGDIRDRSAVQQAVDKAQPAIIFHMAAQPLVRESYADPLTTLGTNVMGTANLLEAARSCETVKAIVVVTSDKCYLNREWHWSYRENEALGGHDPYSASKACTELVAQSWQQSFHSDPASRCSIATARAGNVIGGGDWSRDRLIPDVLKSLNSDQPVVLRNPDAIRPWQHVLEPLAGYMLLAEKLFVHGQEYATAWNFGPHDSDTQTVRWIVERLIQQGSAGGKWSLEPGAQPHEAQLLKLDSSRARNILGWKNVWSLDQCLQEIAHWNRQWKDGADMSRETLQTIERFSADC